MNQKGNGYNERLFGSRGIRSFFHNSRFNWFRNYCEKTAMCPNSIFELGCFDGRLTEFLPTIPERYVGFDADWEGGLTSAQEKFRNQKRYKFVRSICATDLSQFPDDSFELCVALETLEHLPPEEVDIYLQQIARICSHRFIVTVPNEKGPIFLLKYLVKRFLYNDAQQYSWKEVSYATIGKMDRVERDDHKGFDFSTLISQIESHFSIERVEAVPFRFLPRVLGFTIGIVARKRRQPI